VGSESAICCISSDISISIYRAGALRKWGAKVDIIIMYGVCDGFGFEV